MADGDSTWYCNNSGHPHATYGAAQQCDLTAHRQRRLEQERAEAEARRRREGK